MSGRLIVEADGGSRGNPGPAAYGAVVRDSATGEVLAEVAEAIGVATNNVAEYRGLIAGLSAARTIDPSARVEVRLDSRLIVEQMSGRWKIKHADLQTLAEEARQVLPPEQVTYLWVPRNQNVHADRLVNRALDGEPASPTAVEAEHPALPPAVLDLSTATTMLLVRHGQTPDTAERRFAGGGVPGAALDPVGAAQAAAVATALADSGARAVVASPMVRTQQTAGAIADRLGVTVTTDVEWRECDFGAWEGLVIEEATERFPAEMDGWRTSTANPAPGGESLDQMADRILRARHRLLERFQGETVVIVTHSMPIRAIVRAALGAPTLAIHHLRPAPGSVTELLTYPGGATTITGFGLRPWQQP